MAAATTCVRVRLSVAAMYGTTTEAMSLLAIRQDLERFGEIAQAGVRTVNDWQKVVQATYFDVRGAQAAREYFGDFCDYGPQEGALEVTVPQAVYEGLDLAEVASVASAKGGDVLVGFFDTRAATRAAEARALAAAAPQDCEAVSTCDSLGAVEDGSQSETTEDDDADTPQSVRVTESESPVSVGTSGPRQISGLRMTQIRWEDFSAKREWRTALLLRGLPRALCQPGQIQDLLEANGLAGAVSSVRLPRSCSTRSAGHAVVTASSVEQVPRLAKFFHGKQFGSSMPVAVSFAPANQMPLVRGRGSTASSSPIALGAPRKVRLPSGSEQADTSDSSALGSPRRLEPLATRDVAASRGIFSSPATPPGLVMLPPGLPPPPGLSLPSSVEVAAA